MRKIVVLGSSIAAVKAVGEIHKLEPESEIVILSLDGSYPHDRTLFIPILAKELDYKKILYKTNDFYEKNHIQIVIDSKVNRINLRRNKITLEDKRQFDYDVLIIADALDWKVPEIKGNNKSGHYSLKRLKEIERIIDILPLIESVVIQSDSLEGLRVANAFTRRDKEVFLIVSTPTILAEYLDADLGQKVAEIIQNDKLHIICNNEIVEMLGEGEIKAVRLKTKKVIAAQLVIFPDAQEDFRLLGDSSLTINRSILINEHLYTGVECIFAVDRAASLDNLDKASLEEQGRVIASTLKGEAIVFQWPVVQQSLILPNLNMIFIGRMPTQISSRSYTSFDSSLLIGKKVFLEEGRVVGAFLLNVPAEIERIVQLVQGTITLNDFPEFTITVPHQVV